MSKKVERRLVWSSWLRISHGLIAISTLALMLTSWLSKHAATLTAASSDYHVMSGTALLLGLLLRMWLLFTDKQSAGVAAMIPTRTSLQGVVPMIKFYLSLGKTPLPGWHSHNPLWLPLYGLLLLLLSMMTVTGFVMGNHPIFAGIYLPSMHSGMAFFIWLLVCGHIISVFMHDAKGNHYDVSAMLNGYRIYLIEDLTSDNTATTQHISIGEIGKYKPKSE